MEVVWMKKNLKKLIEKIKGKIGKIGERKIIEIGIVGEDLMGEIIYKRIYMGRK